MEGSEQSYSVGVSPGISAPLSREILNRKVIRGQNYGLFSKEKVDEKHILE